MSIKVTGAAGCRLPRPPPAEIAQIREKDQLDRDAHVVGQRAGSAMSPAWRRRAACD